MKIYASDIDVSELNRLKPWSQHYLINDRFRLGRYENDCESTIVDLESNNFEIKSSDYQNFWNFPRFTMLENIVSLMGPLGSVLDIGCLDGRKTIDCSIKGASSVLGIDIREESIARSNYIKEIALQDNELKDFLKNVSFKYVNKSADSKEFVDAINKKFDTVCSLGILHHLNNHQQHFNNLFKLTNKNVILHSSHLYGKGQKINHSLHKFKLTVKKFFIRNQVFTLKDSNFVEKHDKKDPLKSIDGFSVIPKNPEEISKGLYNAGFKYVLTVEYDQKLWPENYSSNTSYFIAIKD